MNECGGVSFILLFSYGYVIFEKFRQFQFLVKKCFFIWLLIVYVCLEYSFIQIIVG